MKLAMAIGVSQGMVSQWVSGSRPVTAEQCVQIEAVTEGAVKREDLRPADWLRIWPELASRNEASFMPKVGSEAAQNAP